MLRRPFSHSSDTIRRMADADNNNVIGFIASTVEELRDDVATMCEQMVTKEDLARLEGRFDEKLARVDTQLSEKLGRVEGQFTERLVASTTGIRGDIQQIHLRLDTLDHSISSRFNNSKLN